MRAKNTKFPPLPSSYFSLFPFPFSPVFFFSTSCGKIYFDASQQSCNARVKVECKVKPTRSGNILFALLSKKKKNYTYAPWCNKQQQLLRKNSSLWLPFACSPLSPSPSLCGCVPATRVFAYTRKLPKTNTNSKVSSSVAGGKRESRPRNCLTSDVSAIRADMCLLSM